MGKYLLLFASLLLAGCSQNSSSPASATETVKRVAPGALAPPESVIPEGASLRVRLDETSATKFDRRGERFTASLIDPVVVDDRIVLPAGTRFDGHLTQSKLSGRMRGRAVIVRLDSFDLNGRQYAIETDSIERVSRSHKKHNLEMIGGGAGTGAAVGAVAGGGAGALVGVAAGAGAGTVGAFVKERKQERIPAETAMTFSLRAPVQL